MAKGEATRQTIVGRAFQLSTIVGLSGLSIGRLAEDTGLSKSGLFAHFGSKEALEVAVVDEASRQFVQEVMVPAMQHARGLPRLRALFERWLAWGQRSGGCFFISAASELDARPGKPRDALTQSYRDWMDELTTAARLAMDEGHFRPDVDPEQFAFETYSLMLGAHLFGQFLRDPQALARTRRSFERMIASASARPSARDCTTT
jgi:AcrR family transcriptional regulator